MKEFINLIIHEQNSSSVFVFPSEAAAVHWRQEFLEITGKKAVRNDRFLSWDSFKEQITLHDREDRPLNSILRRLFAADMIRKNSGDSPIFLKLIPAEFAGLAAAFTDNVYRVLPELKRLIEIIDSGKSGFEPLLEADYRLLYAEYLRFMAANGLFEPSWELPDLQKLKRSYHIICPELIEDFDEYSQILSRAGCSFLTVKAVEPLPLRLFENSVIETDAVLNEISELLKSGVHYSDLAVTCVDNDTAGLLLAKAALRNIPLNFRRGKPLSEYPAGRLPELLRACRIGSYSIGAMKNLLLYRAFIWKDSQTVSSLIRFGIENRCLKNTSPGKDGDIWAQRLWAAKEIELLDFYKKLKKRIEAVSKCRSFEQLAKEIQVFISAFLETDVELWEEGCEQVFQRTREVLASLRETEARLKDITVEDPLGLWIEMLKEKIYVPQQKGPGVAVYPYRVSALINPAVHFVTGLSHDSSTVISAAFGFLTDQQRKEIGAEENNMTTDFIAHYGFSGKDVKMSCSSENPGGVALPPGLFIESGTIERIFYSPDEAAGNPVFNDPVLAENLWWEDACSAAPGVRITDAFPELCSIQLEGFLYASDTFMQFKGFDASDQVFPRGDNLERILASSSDKEGCFRVSASALNRWTACPFNQLLEGMLNVLEDEYILQVEDPMTAGNVMHEIMHVFFRMLKERGGTFNIGRHEEYRTMIKDAAADVFKQWEDKKNYFFGPAWEALQRRVVQDLLYFPAAEAELYTGMLPVELEKWLDFIIEPEHLRAGGYIDRISAGDEGAVIVDYKKSWSKQSRGKFISIGEDGGLLPPEKGYQLPFYILLARAAGMKVAGSSYYSIQGRKHFPVSGPGGVLSDEDVEALCELTLNDIKKMAAAAKNGDFRAVQRCSGCGLRAVCRKRFNIRWSSK